METKYIIWIENGMTSMAKIVDDTKENEYRIINACAVMNMEYGLTAELQPVSPTDPKAVTIRFTTKMAPYVLPNGFASEENSAFVLHLDNITYNCITEDNDIVKVYKATMDSFKK